MEVDPSRYLRTGRLQVTEGGPGGLPQVLGGEPRDPGDLVAESNLICNGAPGRPPCDHYIAVVMEADGVARGFEEMRRIRRFCKRLSTASELFEITGNIYGCSARNPNASNAVEIVAQFEQSQRDLAAESAETEKTVDL